jgi:hypothetical protein
MTFREGTLDCPPFFFPSQGSVGFVLGPIFFKFFVVLIFFISCCLRKNCPSSKAQKQKQPQIENLTQSHLPDYKPPRSAGESTAQHSRGSKESEHSNSRQKAGAKKGTESKGEGD